MDQQNYNYLISLDGVDLNYLRTTPKIPNGKVTPLWTKNNSDMSKDEYYEFKFSSTERDADDNTEDTDKKIEEIHYTLCGICDIDVPSTFLNEHHDSVKHTINLKIANTALERVKNSVNTLNKGKKSCKSLYFCPVCVVAVEMKEKKLHNKSMLHKNTVKLEKIFTEFSNLYTNDGEGDDSDNSEYEIAKAIKKNVKKKNNLKSNINVKKYSVPENKNVNIPIVESTKNIEDNEIKTKVDILEKDLTRKYEKLMMQFDTLSTNTDNFFKDNIDIKKQESDSEINDKTTLNSKITECSKYSCEKDTEFVTDKTKVVKNENLNEISTDINKQESHASNVHHHLEVTHFFIYCKVCKKNIALNEFDHIKDLKHEINYELFIEENSLYRTDSKHIECRICNLSFLCEDEISHCDGIRHITNCERLKKRNSC